MDSSQVPIIEKGVPIPPARRRGVAHEMEINDSVMFETERQAHGLVESLRKMGRKGIQRKLGMGWRVWRVR